VGYRILVSTANQLLVAEDAQTSDNRYHPQQLLQQQQHQVESLTAPLLQIPVQMVSTSADSTSVTIGGLDKYRPYSVAVASVTSRAGSDAASPYSDPIVVRTEEDGTRSLGTPGTNAPACPLASAWNARRLLC
jgi:hypothetical protein